MLYVDVLTHPAVILFTLFYILVMVVLPRVFGTSGSKARTAYPPTTDQVGAAHWVYSMQGMRAHMEDYFSYMLNLNGDSSNALFGVFDGHGGHQCAEYVSQKLSEAILAGAFESDPVEALISGFENLDRDWLAHADKLRLDAGTTAVTALVYKKTLYIANCGDSRAVLASGGRAMAMSVDHKPHRLDERERIRALGGRIIHYGTLRVEGVLAVTRSLGDRKWKRYISATPEVVTRQLQPEDDYLILASDGLWDCVSNQEAVRVVDELKRDIRHAAKTLCHLAFQRGSMDNITAFIIDLKTFL